MTVCLHCGVLIAPPKRKFCCKEHKNLYNHKHLYNYKYTKKYRAKSPSNFMRHLATYKKRSEHFDLTFLEELHAKQKGVCAISGVEMTYLQEGGKCPTNISIDRIDSSRGYEKDNIQLVCSLVNTMKMQYSEEVLIEWCKKIIDFQESKK